MRISDWSSDVYSSDLMFTEIEFPKTIPDSALQPELDPAKFQRVTRFVPEPKPFNVDSEADAQFANLPPGYHVAMRDVRPTLDGQGVVEHMLLSDGLSAISVRSEERRVGKECVSTCRSRWSP